MARTPSPQTRLGHPDGDVVKIYLALVEMADRVSQRRQAANSFYLSVNTALIGGAAFLTGSAENPSLWVLSVAGIAICALWVRNVRSYKTLNAAKFEVIHDIETRLEIQPYTDEWTILDPANSGKRHTAFHNTEVLVPYVFIVVHLVQAGYSFPLSNLISVLLRAIF